MTIQCMESKTLCNFSFNYNTRWSKNIIEQNDTLFVTYFDAISIFTLFNINPLT